MPEGGRRQVKSNAQRPAMNNYYQGQLQPGVDSPFQKKQPKTSYRAKLSRWLDIAILILVILCLVYSLIVKADPKVVTTSTVYHSSSEYQLAAQKAINTPKDFTKLTFDESSAIAKLESQFPEIQNANIELPLFGQRPIVRLSIAEPEFSFTSKNQNYVLASNGIIIPTGSKSKQFASLPTINDQSGLSVQPGKPVLSPNQVQFINQVVSQLKAAKVPIASLTLPPAAQEFDIRTKDKSYYVKFYLGGSAAVQTGQLLAARHQFAGTHQDPSQYLDVRVAGKIFYK